MTKFIWRFFRDRCQDQLNSCNACVTALETRLAAGEYSRQTRFDQAAALISIYQQQIRASQLRFRLRLFKQMVDKPTWWTQFCRWCALQGARLDNRTAPADICICGAKFHKGVIACFHANAKSWRQHLIEQDMIQYDESKKQAGH